MQRGISIILIIVPMIYLSCSNRTSTSKEIYTNDFLTIKIIDNWTEFAGSDESQFFAIKKENENFNTNIIFLKLDKKQFETYGLTTAKKYANSLAENFESKAEYKLISKMDSVNIDGKTFYRSEFILSKNGKERLQSFYTVDFETYFFGLIATDDKQQPEPEIEMIIQSIKFK